jgi:deoxycytidylate deaminase
MLAYVELVQRKEKEIGCDVLTHQKWLVVSFVRLSWAVLMSFTATGVVQITSTESCKRCHQVRRALLRLERIQQNTRSEIVDRAPCINCTTYLHINTFL